MHFTQKIFTVVRVVPVYYRFYYEWWLSYADLYYFMEYMR